MKRRTVLAGATALGSLAGVGHAAPAKGWYAAIEGGALQQNSDPVVLLAKTALEEPGIDLLANIAACVRDILP